MGRTLEWPGSHSLLAPTQSPESESVPVENVWNTQRRITKEKRKGSLDAEVGFCHQMGYCEHCPTRAPGDSLWNARPHICRPQCPRGGVPSNRAAGGNQAPPATTPTPSLQLLRPGVPRGPPTPTQPQPPQRGAHKPLSHLYSPRPDLTAPLAEPPHLVSPSPKPPAASGTPPHATFSCPGGRAFEDSCTPHPGALGVPAHPASPTPSGAPHGATSGHLQPLQTPHPPGASAASHVFLHPPSPSG